MGLVAHRMIHMTMSIDGQDRLQLMAVDEAKELILFSWRGTTGVDDNTLASVIINNIGILRKRIENERFDLEHDTMMKGLFVELLGKNSDNSLSLCA